MDIKYLGTEYGGWDIDIESINNGDTIIDAGLGEDISFLEDLKKYRDVNIIGIDPTEKSHIFLKDRKIENFNLIKKAIAPSGINWVRMNKNKNPNHVSESYFNDHGSVDPNLSYNAECISFTEIISKFSPSLIKMDIEGAEYEVLSECIGIKQICVEFHHHCMSNKKIEDTEQCIKKMEQNGYKIISSRNGIEFTLLKN